MKHAVVLALFVAAAIGLVWCFSDWETPRLSATQPSSPNESVATEFDKPETRLEPSTPVEAAVAITKTAENVLQEYWGSDWTAMRDEYLKQGVDLNSALELKRWEDVLPQIEEQVRFTPLMQESFVQTTMRWPAKLDSNWLEDNFGFQSGSLSDDDVARVEDLVKQKNADIHDVSVHAVSLMEQALVDALYTGRVARAPLTSKVLRTQPWETGNAFYSTSGVAGGWSVRLAVTDELYPDIAYYRNQAKELIHERNADIRRLLSR